MKTRKRRPAKPHRLLVGHGTEDYNYLRPASEDGDWWLLAKYIEEGNVITPAMRGFLAAVLRGAKRKRGAPKSAEVRELDHQILIFVLYGGRAPAEAKKAAAKEFGVSKRKVERTVKKFNDYQMEELRYLEEPEDWADQDQDYDGYSDDKWLLIAAVPREQVGGEAFRRARQESERSRQCRENF